MNRLIWWGESMYGGYYADIVKDDNYSGIRANTQKELKMQLAENGIEPKLPNDKRRDSIFG